MINRHVIGAHYGLRDWLAQRASAIIMAIYSVMMLIVFLVIKPSGFVGWHAVFSCGLVKFATFIAALALFYHAWIGMRDIWMDYIKPTGLRLFLHVLTISVLLGYTGWAAAILWRL